MQKNIFRVLSLVLLLAVPFVQPAYANHEGTYIVGEVKEIEGAPGCIEKGDMVMVFNRLPDTKEMVQVFQRLRSEKKCGLFVGTAKIIGQIGNDVRDNEDTPWRIVHIQYLLNNVPTESYLLTWGTETSVTKK